MTVEAARQPTASDTGVESSAATLPQEIYRAPEQKAPEYELPLQKDINDRLMHLFGPDFMPAVSRRALRERGRALREVINGIPEDVINSGSLTEDQCSEIGDRTSCVRIAAGLLATRYGINLNEHIDAKLLSKMQVKYRPDDVMEIIYHGTPQSPGPKTGLEAFALLKQGFDEATGIQPYENRGLPIPEYEADARIPKTKYTGVRQDIANLWQVSALGTHLVPSERFVNLIDKDGEIQEAVDVFDGMTGDEMAALLWVDSEEHPLLQDLGGELSDVFISTWCVDSAIGVDSNLKDKERMDIAVKKYGDGPKLRRANFPFDTRMKHMDERFKREKMGLRPPLPLGTITWEIKQ